MPRSLQAFKPLQFDQFRYLWLAQIAQALSLWTEQIARPLLVLSIGGSAIDLGFVIAIRTIPQIAGGFVAGVIADWYNRRTILITSKTASTILNISLGIIILSGQIELWHIYIQALLKGAVNAFDQPARQAMIPSIIPPEHLTSAVALNSATMNTMRILGAAGAGFLVAFSGFGWTFIFSGVVSSFAIFFTILMQNPTYTGNSASKNIRSGIDSFKEGLNYAWHNPLLKWVMVLALIYFCFGMSYMQVFAPLFATEILLIGASGLGIMLSINGFGGLIGGITLATINPTQKRGIGMLGVTATFGLMLIIFSLSTYTSSQILPFLILIPLGMVQTPFIALANSVLLAESPEKMRGRVMSLMSFDRSIITVGGALAGILCESLGVQPSQIIFGGCLVIGAIIISLIAPVLYKNPKNTKSQHIA